MDGEGTKPVRREEQLPPPYVKPTKGQLGKDTEVSTTPVDPTVNPKNVPKYSLLTSEKEFTASQNVKPFMKAINKLVNALRSFFSFLWKVKQSTPTPDHTEALQKAMSGGDNAADFIALFREKGNKDAIVKQADKQFEQAKKEFQAAKKPDVDKLVRAFVLKEYAHANQETKPNEIKPLMYFTMGNLGKELKLDTQFTTLVNGLEMKSLVTLEEKDHSHFISSLTVRADLVPPKVEESPVQAVDRSVAFSTAAKGNPIPLLKSMKQGDPAVAVKKAQERYESSKTVLQESWKKEELSQLAKDVGISETRFAQATTFPERIGLIKGRIESELLGAEKTVKEKKTSDKTASMAYDAKKKEIEAKYKGLSHESELAFDKREATDPKNIELLRREVIVRAAGERIKSAGGHRKAQTALTEEMREIGDKILETHSEKELRDEFEKLQMQNAYLVSSVAFNEETVKLIKEDIAPQELQKRQKAVEDITKELTAKGTREAQSALMEKIQEIGGKIAEGTHQKLTEAHQKLKDQNVYLTNQKGFDAQTKQLEKAYNAEKSEREIAQRERRNKLKTEQEDEMGQCPERVAYDKSIQELRGAENILKSLQTAQKVLTTIQGVTVSGDKAKALLREAVLVIAMSEFQQLEKNILDTEPTQFWMNFLQKKGNIARLNYAFNMELRRIGLPEGDYQHEITQMMVINSD